MTTIAASLTERVMCSDSLWSDGDSCGLWRKVFRCRGELLGMAGSIDECVWWRDSWKRAPFDTMGEAKTVTVLRLAPAALWTWSNLEGWIQIEERQFAVGSGGKVARGAMAAGARCRRAVAIAIQIDAGTGGRVRSYSI